MANENPKPEAAQEHQAMLANDVRVLVGQLNERLCAAAECGLEVRLTATPEWYVKTPALRTRLSVTVLAEVR